MRFSPALSGFLVAGSLAASMAARLNANAQSLDPAVVGERIIRLTAAVESLELSMASQKRQIDSLGNELSRLREEITSQGAAMQRNSSQRPWSDDVKRLADAITEVDRKRAADGEQVVKVLNELKRAVAASTDVPKPSKPASGGGRGSGARGASGGDEPPADKGPDKALEYVLEQGQLVYDVVVSFNEEAKKQGYQTLSVAEVLKFNNIKDDRRIRAGTKILLPVIPAH
ncbi:MAG: hypothetical protein AB7O66_06290 [Limisphaerales bacterium]